MLRDADPVRATRHSWSNIQPLPDVRARLSFQREFTQEEYEAISWGLVPEAMEDKWFIFLEDDMLYFHRSWTGFCIYEVRLAKDVEKCLAVETYVSREPSQYNGADDDYDERLLSFLIDNLLLGDRARFPRPSGVPAGIASELYQHHIAGRGRKEDEATKRKRRKGWLWRLLTGR